MKYLLVIASYVDCCPEIILEKQDTEVLLEIGKE